MNIDIKKTPPNVVARDLREISGTMACRYGVAIPYAYTEAIAVLIAITTRNSHKFQSRDWAIWNKVVIAIKNTAGSGENSGGVANFGVNFVLVNEGEEIQEGCEFLKNASEWVGVPDCNIGKIFNHKNHYPIRKRV